MGYTHYWSIVDWKSPEWQKAWAQLIKDVPRIIDAANIEISGPTEDVEIVTPPRIDRKEGIWINGISDDAHEPIVIEHGEWTFCKTARKPYDVVVITILLRAAMLAPNQFKVSSDGYWEEWCDGRDLYAQLWPGETIKCPLRGYEEDEKEAETNSEDRKDAVCSK